MTAPIPDFVLRVRDKFLNIVGEIDDYQSLELRLRYNDVSTWQLTLDRRHPMADVLCTPGNGIILRRIGSSSVTLSGPWTEQTHERTGNVNTVTLSGIDDTGWLARRLVYPDPNDIVPPYNTQIEDVQTGKASSVMYHFVHENAGLGAPTERRVHGLAVGADPNIGPTVTFSGRWQNLLSLVQEIAVASEAGGVPLGFIARQNVFLGQNTISFFEFAVPDHTSVRFSHELGNMASFTYKRTAPTSNYAIVGGEGEGTARLYAEKPDSVSVAEWGRIEGELSDSRNGSTTAEMKQAADHNLAENASTTSLSITPIDTPDQQYGVHYTLGSKVTVIFDVLGGSVVNAVPTQIQDIVREVSITLSPESMRITPSIGSQGTRVSATKIFQSMRKLTGRVVNLERR